MINILKLAGLVRAIGAIGSRLGRKNMGEPQPASVKRKFSIFSIRGAKIEICLGQGTNTWTGPENMGIKIVKKVVQVSAILSSGSGRRIANFRSSSISTKVQSIAHTTRSYPFSLPARRSTWVSPCHVYIQLSSTGHPRPCLSYLIASHGRTIVIRVPVSPL